MKRRTILKGVIAALTAPREMLAGCVPTPSAKRLQFIVVTLPPVCGVHCGDYVREVTLPLCPMWKLNDPA